MKEDNSRLAAWLGVANNNILLRELPTINSTLRSAVICVFGRGRVVTLLYLVSLAVGVTYVAKFKVARYPEFSRSTHLESKLIEFFVLVKF